MLIIEHTVTTTATPEAVWNQLEKVSEWPEWDGGLETAQLVGPFAQGAQLKLKPKGSPNVVCTLSECTAPYSFTSTSKLPLATMIFSHKAEQKEGKTIITHRIEMVGLLQHIFGFLIGQKIKAELPNAMKKLALLAEKS